MNNEELIAIRNFLNLDIDAEAARLLAADEEHPNGVNRRSWQRWEKGEFNIPEGIEQNVENVKKRRAEILAYHLDRGTKEIKIPYELQETDPIEFKIQVSVIYELYIKGRIKILIA
ncbi:DUF1870 family protein [uncultured Gilliamella sp.]|uniref:Aca2/YdiL-like domain-containing protein n=1 Tax=uncultured Gilliamella sp. TaxID=1193505 RepID=UPI0025EE3F1C|nr:DUF1870 family protein [uncultured Gilliamella sp.]